MKISGRENILKLITMERVLTRAADTSERREWQLEWAFSYLNNSVVSTPLTRHFLWSILYVIYNSYLRLLIWGRKRLMNFVLQPVICWLFFYSFFHGMQRNLGWLPVHSWSPRSQGLNSFYPMVYSVTPEVETWLPEGTTGTDYKKSDGWGREKRKTKIRARKMSPCKVKPKEKNSCMRKCSASV